MSEIKTIKHIVNWLKNYCEKSNTEGFVIGISGGIDSALTSKLCALTGKPTHVIELPLRQKKEELIRSENHIKSLKKLHDNVNSTKIELSDLFQQFEKTMPHNVSDNLLAMANSRSRLRMTTLYAIAQNENKLVVGTGNKIEDFGVGFFTKYGDGGVDISPIADLTKTQVRELSKYLNINSDIINAAPTDGLWDVERNDENQLGATYEELEWAMANQQNTNQELTIRQKEVIEIYKKFNNQNKHKMEPIPVCIIPENKI
jgi:NAD+ synthase